VAKITCVICSKVFFWNQLKNEESHNYCVNMKSVNKKNFETDAEI